MYICPPKEGLSMLGHVMTFPHYDIKFQVSPANKNQETIDFVNKVVVTRF